MRSFIEALEKCIQTENWYGALFIALTLPDICGSVDEPNLGPAKRSINWFDRYLSCYFKSNSPLINSPNPRIREKILNKPDHVKNGAFMTGGDFFALRCAYLHQGLDDLSDHGKAKCILDKFVFVFSHYTLQHLNLTSNALQVDVVIFCQNIAAAVNSWLAEISGDSEKQERIQTMAKIHIV